MNRNTKEPLRLQLGRQQVDRAIKGANHQLDDPDGDDQGQPHQESGNKVFLEHTMPLFRNPW
jgi:hypothetical protein